MSSLVCSMMVKCVSFDPILSTAHTLPTCSYYFFLAESTPAPRAYGTSRSGTFMLLYFTSLRPHVYHCFYWTELVVIYLTRRKWKGGVIGFGAGLAVRWITYVIYLPVDIIGYLFGLLYFTLMKGNIFFLRLMYHACDVTVETCRRIATWLAAYFVWV